MVTVISRGLPLDRARRGHRHLGLYAGVRWGLLRTPFARHARTTTPRAASYSHRFGIRLGCPRGTCCRGASTLRATSRTSLIFIRSTTGSRRHRPTAQCSRSTVRRGPASTAEVRACWCQPLMSGARCPLDRSGRRCCTADCKTERKERCRVRVRTNDLGPRW
jgi:hypothetical protein